MFLAQLHKQYALQHFDMSHDLDPLYQYDIYRGEDAGVSLLGSEKFGVHLSASPTTSIIP